MEAHAGRVDVTSEIGQGTTFTCTFPVVQPAKDTGDGSATGGELHMDMSRESSPEPMHRDLDGAGNSVGAGVSAGNRRKCLPVRDRSNSDAGDGHLNSPKLPRSSTMPSKQMMDAVQVLNRKSSPITPRSPSGAAPGLSAAGTLMVGGVGGIVVPGGAAAGTQGAMSCHFEKTGRIEVLSVDDDPVNQMVVENLLYSR